MVGYLRCFCSMYVAVLAACMPQTVRAQHDAQSAPRRLDVMIGNSDEYAETVVSLLAPERSLGIGLHDHAKITSILSTTKEMIKTAKALIDDERTLKEGTEMMEEANSMFGEVKDHIAKRALEAEAQGRVRRKYSEHDIQQAEEDEGRALDVARSVYEVVSQCTMPGLHHYVYANIVVLLRIAIQDDLIPRVYRKALTRMPQCYQPTSCGARPRHPRNYCARKAQLESAWLQQGCYHNQRPC